MRLVYENRGRRRVGRRAPEHIEDAALAGGDGAIGGGPVGRHPSADVERSGWRRSVRRVTPAGARRGRDLVGRGRGLRPAGQATSIAERVERPQPDVLEHCRGVPAPTGEVVEHIPRVDGVVDSGAGDRREAVDERSGRPARHAPTASRGVTDVRAPRASIGSTLGQAPSQDPSTREPIRHDVVDHQRRGFVADRPPCCPEARPQRCFFAREQAPTSPAEDGREAPEASRRSADRHVGAIRTMPLGKGRGSSPRSSALNQCSSRCVTHVGATGGPGEHDRSADRLDLRSRA